jgi:hypothetical protein
MNFIYFAALIPIRHTPLYKLLATSSTLQEASFALFLALFSKAFFSVHLQFTNAVSSIIELSFAPMILFVFDLPREVSLVVLI